MNLIVFVNGVVLFFLAFLMGLDALFFPNTAAIFGEAGMLTGTFGLLLMIASYSSFDGMRRLHAYLLTTSVWLSAALGGALPLYFASMSPVDAIFEAMSGVTTTGSTVMSGLDQTEHGILLWRALLQALGGVGFIVTGIALLPILKVGGMQLFQTESSEREEKVLTSVNKIAAATLFIYLGLIALCCLTYLAGGMDFFDAITHAMTTLSTGGYSNYDASFGHFESSFLQWSATLFMLLGALPFVWYIRAGNRQVFRSEQVKAMLVSLTVVILSLTAWLSWADGIALLPSLRLVAFNVISVVSTTGYATEDYTTWGPLAVCAFVVLTAVGGCTGSTAGGAKAMRWIIALRSAVLQVKRLHYPRSVFILKYEGRPVSEGVLSGVISFFTFYFATFLILALALGMFGMDLTSAVSGALTSLANVGPGVGSVIGPAGNFASLDDPEKILLVFGMFIGRLEMLTVFVLFSPAFWREV